MVKQKIRMVGLDLDGTVFNEEKQITEHTREVLQRAAAEGVVVLPATGRPDIGLPEEMLEIPGIRYALTCNGARIIEIPSRKLIYQQIIPWEVTHRVIEMMDSWDHCAWEVYVEGEILVEEGKYQVVRHPDMSPALFAYILKSRKPRKDLVKWMNEEKIGAAKLHMIFDDTEERNCRLKQLQEAFPELDVTYASTFNIELNAKTAGKGYGLLALGEILGISREEIMACGDAANDWNMLTNAGFAVAMANGTAKTREMADFITRSNEEDGVAYAVEQYVLQDRYKILPGQMEDIPQIMKIVREAQEDMEREQVPQWQKGYPNEEVITQDIQKGYCYVVKEGEEILGFCALCLGEEPTYRYIEGGAWTTGEVYATIHRIGVAEDRKCQGIATYLYDGMERICREKGIPAFRIDTHQKNQKMQAWIEKRGFRRCGVIYVDDGGVDSPRDAFEKEISGIKF